MNRIREIREANGLSQASLYRKLEWSQSRLANYELGVRGIALDSAWRIIGALRALGAACSFESVFPDAQQATCSGEEIINQKGHVVNASEGAGISSSTSRATS